MLINNLIAFPFLLLLPQEQPEKSLYPLKTLNSLIGNPNHPHMALSPDNKMELFVEDNGDVILRDFNNNSEKELANTDGRDSWYGTSRWRWMTSGHAASFLNDGKNAITISRGYEGETIIWDTKDWSNATKSFHPDFEHLTDRHVKFSNNKRYIAIEGDGPKYGAHLSIIDLKEKKFNLLYGMMHDSEKFDTDPKISRYHPFNGNPTSALFTFGFTPDDKYLIFKETAENFTFYKLDSGEILKKTFPEPPLTDPRFLNSNFDPKVLSKFCQESSDEYGMAMVKEFQKAIKEDRLDIVECFYKYPSNVLLEDGTSVVLFSKKDFYANYDRMFSKEEREGFISNAEVVRARNAIMLGNGHIWFTIDGEMIHKRPYIK